MQKRVLTAIGVLLSAALTIQTATAATRSARKSARTLDPVTQQPRDAFGSVDWPSTARSGHSYYSGRHGLSAPAAGDNKSCDIIWCYEN
jgi:hypothetical protein